MFRLWECAGGKKNESDEYAFHYCCDVMTGLMRSMESWASHFVVSPVYSPTQEIHCEFVHRQMHSDGWMLLLMFQTTEDHSVAFLWFTYKHSRVLWWQHLCYSHKLHWNRNACVREIVFTVCYEYKLFSFFHYSCNTLLFFFCFFFLNLIKEGWNNPDLSPQESHSLLPPPLSSTHAGAHLSHNAFALHNSAATISPNSEAAEQ